ncbi:MAG TPA: putative toxin-antitoxin system toxin component, PIN family [Longimicrobium sp.]|nr:putative toxin-antitoxin system toxin component, PIN family [Longimicrobium sp.]
MKIFADTNVLVSAFGTRGLCADLIRHVIAEHELLCGEVVLDELERTLRVKLKVPALLVAAHLRTLRYFPVAPNPTTLPDYDVRDSDDKLVLASAINIGADVLVTGDKDLLSIREQVTELKILEPRALWELIRPSRA